MANHSYSDQLALIRRTIATLRILEREYAATDDRGRPALKVRVEEWTGRGYPTGSGGGSAIGAGGSASSVERAVLDGQTDRAALHAMLASRAIASADTSATQALAAVLQLRPSTLKPEEDDKTGSCLDCGRIVARTKADPLRAGRCTACDASRKRRRADAETGAYHA